MNKKVKTTNESGDYVVLPSGEVLTDVTARPENDLERVELAEDLARLGLAVLSNLACDGVAVARPELASGVKDPGDGHLTCSALYAAVDVARALLAGFDEGERARGRRHYERGGVYRSLVEEDGTDDGDDLLDGMPDFVRDFVEKAEAGGARVTVDRVVARY